MVTDSNNPDNEKKCQVLNDDTTRAIWNTFDILAKDLAIKEIDQLIRGITKSLIELGYKVEDAY